ncbi:MAG: RNA polymerase sigma factor [Acidimicrobiia bacterium]
MESPDVADVVAAAAGDVSAFERLVHATEGHLWRYLVHILGDRALAEDVRQEIFMRVLHKLPSLRDPDRFVPWLFAMARNAAYDASRARRRRHARLQQAVDEAYQATSPDPHLELEVADALARLEPELRETLVLVGVMGLSYAEVAATMGVPEGTVKSRVFRARRQLVSSLEMETPDAY